MRGGKGKRYHFGHHSLRREQVPGRKCPQAGGHPPGELGTRCGWEEGSGGTCPERGFLEGSRWSLGAGTVQEGPAHVSECARGIPALKGEREGEQRGDSSVMPREEGIFRRKPQESTQKISENRTKKNSSL